MAKVSDNPHTSSDNPTERFIDLPVPIACLPFPNCKNLRRSLGLLKLDIEISHNG
jgi:hypothetical protein